MDDRGMGLRLRGPIQPGLCVLLPVLDGLILRTLGITVLSDPAAATVPSRGHEGGGRLGARNDAEKPKPPPGGRGKCDMLLGTEKLLLALGHDCKAAVVGHIIRA